MKLLAEEDVSYLKVVDLIRMDAAFTADVLRLANSPLLGARWEIGSVLQAISLLGVDRLKSLVLTIAMRDFVLGVRHQESLQRSWRHNLACALLAEMVADACWMDKSFAYTAGLLHDIGRLALVAAFPAKYDRLLTSANQGGDMLELERQVFDIDHCEAGRWLVEEWGLPHEFAEIAGGHHSTPWLPDPGPKELVALACRLADHAGLAVTGPWPGWEPSLIRDLLPKTAREKLEPLLPEMPEVIACKVNLFECEFFVAAPASLGRA